MRYLVPLITFVFILALNSCKQNQESSALEPDSVYVQDSLSREEFNFDPTVYSVPSPHQISILVKEGYPHYEEDIFETKIDINNYSTSEKRALILGVLIADLGYLSLYDQKNLQIEYLNKIQQLVNRQNTHNFNSTDLFNRIDSNLGDSDSILMIMSQILRKENEAIRTGERPYLSSLTVAGSWIESFYIINTLYSNSKNSNLFGILLHQKYVLDNLIQQLRPFYKKSIEYTELVDKLVEIAYEFEVVDMNYKHIPPENKARTTFVKCKFTQVLTGSQLEKMNELARSLRKSVIF